MRRRSPRYVRFLVTGGVVGLVAAVALVLAAGSVDERGRLLAYLLALLGGLGALAGGAIAVLFDGRR